MRNALLCVVTLVALSACTPEAATSPEPGPKEQVGPPLVDGRDRIGPVKAVEHKGHEALWTSVRRTQMQPDVVRDRICAANTRDETSAAPRDIGTDCVSTTLTRRGPASLHPYAITFCPPNTKPGAVLDCDGFGVVLVVTSPEVAQLVVEAVDGASVTARELGRTSGLALFVAEFTGPPAGPVPTGIMGHQRFIHTARDSDGTVIDRATLPQRDMAPEPTPPSEDGGVMMQALLTGTLRGDPERRCMWVGKAETGVSILWPSHVAIRRAPLRLVDTRSDTTIAYPGDRVRLTGGSSPQPPSEEPTCRVSYPIFIAHEIERGR